MTAAAIRYEPCTPVIADLFGVPYLEPTSSAAPLSWSEAYQRIDELEEQIADTDRAARQVIADQQREIRELKDELRIAQNILTDIHDLAARGVSHTLGR